MNPAHIDPGLYWFHCTGPDGPCVLLVRVCRFTAVIVDDACREEPWPTDDGRLHKWAPYHVEPVIRPNPRPVAECDVCGSAHATKDHRHTYEDLTRDDGDNF